MWDTPLFVSDRGKNLSQRLNITDSIFNSRDLFYTGRLLKDNNITYIFIDDLMLSSLIWTEEDQGLNFLFRNNETFKKIYSNPTTEIWEFSWEGLAQW